MTSNASLNGFAYGCGQIEAHVEIDESTRAFNFDGADFFYKVGSAGQTDHHVLCLRSTNKSDIDPEPFEIEIDIAPCPMHAQGMFVRIRKPLAEKSERDR